MKNLVGVPRAIYGLTPTWPGQRNVGDDPRWSTFARQAVTCLPDEVTEQNIIDWCRDTMAVYKVPRVVEFIDALPKSGSGKVMWRALQEAEMAKA